MLFALCVIVAIASIPRVTVVTATDLTTGRVILCAPAQPITLLFTHSMYGGDVEETFVPRPDGRITRIEMTTANEAAAEYYAYTAPVIRDGDRFRLDIPPAAFEEVIVRVDAVGRHRLKVAGTEIDLLEATGDKHRVKLDSANVTIVDRLTGHGCR
ncbi:MAG: hypothetical protein ACRDJH_24235 [Thermomicrobiales bacterium]